MAWVCNLLGHESKDTEVFSGISLTLDSDPIQLFHIVAVCKRCKRHTAKGVTYRTVSGKRGRLGCD